MTLLKDTAKLKPEAAADLDALDRQDGRQAHGPRLGLQGAVA